MPAASLRLTNAVSSSVVVTSTNGNYPFGVRGTVRCPAGMRVRRLTRGTSDRLVVNSNVRRWGGRLPWGGFSGLMTGS